MKDCTRIKIITAERDINYEYVKRFLEIAPQNIVDVSNLNITDIQSICFSMNRPSNDAITMIKDNENISLLEIVFSYIRVQQLKKEYRNIFLHLVITKRIV